MLFQRIINRLVGPFRLMCVEKPRIAPLPELHPKHLKNARLLPCRDDILAELPQHGIVAELGVAFGRYSRKILDVMQPTRFVAVDSFELGGPRWFRQQDYAATLGGLRHEAYYRKQFATEIAAGTVVLRKGYSDEVMETFPDAYFDMIYIDAAHDYESVAKDLDVSGRKIKPSGHIVLNDYTIIDPLLLQPYGIVQATHEFCVREGWEIVYLAHHPYMFCDVALRRLLD
jgi:hypothetical protein